MAEFYVRPDAGYSYGNGNGTSYANAFKGFANIQWWNMSDNDTLFVCDVHNDTLTPTKELIIRGDAPEEAGLIDVNDAADYCIAFSGLNGQVHSIDLRNANKNGLYVDSNGKSVTSFVLKDATASGCGKASPGYTADTGTGFLFVNNNVNNSITGIDISGCESNANGKHGFDFRGYCAGTISNCSADGNGFADTGHGFHTNGPVVSVGTSGWSLVSGDVYSKEVGFGWQIQKMRNYSTTYRTKLTHNDGAGSGVGNYEFDQVGTTLYINIGQNPNGITFFANANTQGPLIFSDCTAKNTIDLDGVEGMGFSADNHSENIKFRRCLACGNAGDGFMFNNADSISMESSIATNNGRRGVFFVGSSDSCTVQQCTFVQNGGDGIWMPLSVSATVKNNVCVGNERGIRDENDGSTTVASGTVAKGNVCYGNTVENINLQTPDVSNIEDNPDLYLGVYPVPDSPAVGAGETDTGVILDFLGKRYYSPRPAGAIALGGNVVSNSRLSAGSRNTAFARPLSGGRSNRRNRGTHQCLT